MKKSTKLIALLTGAVFVAAACSSSGASTAPSAAASDSAPSVAPSDAASVAPSIDPESLLGKIIAAGTIRIATDPNYAPFSFLNTTTNEYEGFDTGTAVEVVKRLSEKLGQEITLQWETPGWDTITAGSWGGRWDISIGSMSVTVGREKVVDFTAPYYYDSGSIAVPAASTVQTVAELDGGKTFCVGTATTYEQWLSGTLEIVDPNMTSAPTDPQITALPTDNECIQAVQAGRTYDAIVANSNGLQDAVAKGAPIRILEGPPIFLVSVAFALDKSGPSTESILPILNAIVLEMHADGTLKALSEEWLKQDVTTKPE